MRFMLTELVLQTKNWSEPAKNRFSVALIMVLDYESSYGLMLQHANIVFKIASRNELPHYKTNPVKTQVSLGICPVCSVFNVRSVGSKESKLSLCGQ